MTSANASDRHEALREAMKVTRRNDAAAIIALLSSPQIDVRRHAIVAIGRRRITEAASVLASRLPLEQEELRIAATEVLATLAQPESRTALIDALSDTSLTVRRLAVRGLAALDDPAAVDGAIELFRTGEGAAARNEALAALQRVADRRADSALDGLASAQGSWWWRHRARAARKSRVRNKRSAGDLS